MPSQALTKTKFEVFYSYSHKDEDLRIMLEKHLSMLKRQRVITDWHFRKISAGKEWKEEIGSHLDSAYIILLLISPDFLSSDYCYSVELKKAMTKHKNGEAIVIPVILRPVDWKGLRFSKLQALPKNAKPVTSWRNRDEAFLSIAEGIRKVANELKSRFEKQEKKLDSQRKTRKIPKIVLVEDNRMWRQRLVNLIKTLGVELEAFKDCNDDLLARLSRDDYDLLITDIVLDKANNRRNGYDLAAFARECNKQIQIIFISGIVDYHDVRRAFVKLKVNDFIDKSEWDPTIFLKVVRKAVHRREI